MSPISATTRSAWRTLNSPGPSHPRRLRDSQGIGYEPRRIRSISPAAAMARFGCFWGRRATTVTANMRKNSNRPPPPTLPLSTVCIGRQEIRPHETPSGDVLCRPACLPLYVSLQRRHDLLKDDQELRWGDAPDVPLSEARERPNAARRAQGSSPYFQKTQSNPPKLPSFKRGWGGTGWGALSRRFGKKPGNIGFL
jgi:hypothetical protein